MVSDTQIINGHPENFKYEQRDVSIVNGDTIFWYNVILIINEENYESHVSEFTEFFYHKDRLKNEHSTNKNNYGTAIRAYLQYIFIDRDKPIKNIEDITIELGNEFLNKFALGEYGGKKSKNGTNKIKTDRTIEIAEMALTRFYHWLCCKTKGKYKMKHIKRTDFQWHEVEVHTNGASRGNEKRNITVLESLFAVEKPHKMTKKKLDRPSELLIFTLLSLAQQYDPIMAFPIALGCFGGLRIGEICQMCRKRVEYYNYYGILTGFYIDLQEEYILRNDAKKTGGIKRPRVQLIYEAFLPSLDKWYKEHLDILKDKGIDCDAYGAMVIGKNGKAMSAHTFRRKFYALTLKLLKRLHENKKLGDIDAAKDYDLLKKFRMTPHVMRYFFSQYIARREQTHILAMYRGDLSLQSALTYLKDSQMTSDYIKEIQDSFEHSYLEKTSPKENVYVKKT